MSQYDTIATAFENADTAFPDVTRPALYSVLEQSLKPGTRVLDLGCGNGTDLAYFVSKGAQASGIDESNEQVQLAQNKCPGATVVCSDFATLPFAKDSFDVVYSRYSLQHRRNMQPVFEEVARVLRHNGEFLFLVTHPLRQYLEKTTKNYEKQEDITSVILGGAVTVTEPSHTFSEYLSPALLDGFTLREFREFTDPAATRIAGHEAYPGVAVFDYREEQ